MIKIIMFEGKWRIIIEDEKFEFETREDLDKILKGLLDIKDKFGRLK